MKKIITLLLSLSLLANTAIASDDIDNLKKEVSESLNHTVKTLKEYFKKTDTELKLEEIIVKDAKEKAYVLKESSQAKETNPVVLKQGTASMPNCSSNEELQWVDSSWACVVPSYGTDCYPAKDEYKYYVDGKAVCSKSAEGKLLNYYWKFRGYYPNCGSDAKRAKVYGCYYTNKLGVEVEISDANCNGKDKPSVAEYVCYANWKVGGWGYCNQPCRSYGSQSRSVTCASNHVCAGSKPATTQRCGGYRECGGDHPGSHGD
jgi:hypothetical protein